jgi:hypothetical protein
MLLCDLIVSAMLTWTVHISVDNSRAGRAETRMNTEFGGFSGGFPLAKIF